MAEKILEFKEPKIRGKARRVLVLASSIEGLVEESDEQCDLHLSFASITIAGSFDENAARWRGAVDGPVEEP